MKSRGRGARAAPQKREESESLNAIIKQARQSGQLNLSNRSLAEVPVCVWRINMEGSDDGRSVSMSDNVTDRWWEQIDLTKLILACNALTQISTDIQLLPALTVLDLHDNRISSLPESLSTLKNLQRLNVSNKARNIVTTSESHNELEKFPECITNLSELQFLTIDRNRITELPDSICNLYRVEELNISHNRLSSLPKTIDGLSGVMRLNVSNNSLQTLPIQITCLTRLRVLDVEHNELRVVPDDLKQMTHLESILLRHNHLNHLPDLNDCVQLKELYAGNNELTGISIEKLCNLSRLSILDLRDNQISVLSDDICKLEALERLDLTNNQLSALPFSLGTMNNLKAISLEGNPLRAIRRDIIMRGTMELKKYLRERMSNSDPSSSLSPSSSSTSTSSKTSSTSSSNTGRLEKLQLNDVPSGIIGNNEGRVDVHKLKASRIFECTNKKMSELSDDTWSAIIQAHVVTINLNKNLFSAVPHQVYSLEQSLAELYLAGNKISSISADMGRLTRLTTIDISCNQLDALPSEMKTLQSLREIILSFNRFKNIPEVLYELKKLEIILISDNQVSELNVEGVKSLSKLATVDLRNNNLSNVPPELGNCTQILSLQLEGNPLRQIRVAILSKGTNAVLEYLRSRIPA